MLTEIKINWDGFKKMILKTGVWSRAMPIAVAEELQRKLTEIMEQDIKPNRVPVRTGKLRDSGKVEIQQVSETEARIRISFGGPGIDYSVEVHEDTTRFHPHGQAKYLTGPMQNEYRPAVKDAIRMGLSITFSGGKK